MCVLSVCVCGGSVVCVCVLLCGASYVTEFWKISPNVTFYNSNIYNQNEERELPINLKVVTMCSSYLELPENNWKYFENFCNPFAVVTINCVTFKYFNVTLRLIFQNRVTYSIAGYFSLATTYFIHTTTSSCLHVSSTHVSKF